MAGPVISIGQARLGGAVLTLSFQSWQDIAVHSTMNEKTNAN